MAGAAPPLSPVTPGGVPPSAAPGPPPGAGLAGAAARLASLLTGSGDSLSDPGGTGGLVFEGPPSLRPLRPGPAPRDAWAVDGGQAVVADARCLQLLVTRAARVRFRGGCCTLEEPGELRAAVLGLGEAAAARRALGLEGLAADCAVDVNLLRDRWEWEAVERSVDEAEPGAVVLVDGDLQPDWRIPGSYVAGLLERAAQRGVLVAGVTKHSSLAAGGAPLVGRLEAEAADELGPRATWWAAVARTEPRRRPALRVVVARLDPDARFAFRIDLPAAVDPEPALAALAALSDDAAFPGYPYPLSVADRLAACPPWLRHEVRMQVDDHLDRAGVALGVRERAFTDRHGLMERA